MKAGIAAAVFAAEAIRRAGVPVPGTIEVSGTVDEESGGFAGVAWLAEHGRLSATRTDYCIIPEPLNVDRRLRRASRRLLVRGGDARAHRARQHAVPRRQRHRRHGSPAAGDSRGADAGARDARTTEMPVVPIGARQATLNINGIFGGQPVDGIQTPCVADVCRAVFDRRFLLEEGFEATRREVEAVLDRRARPRAARRVRAEGPDGRAPDADARRLAGDCRHRARRPARARPAGDARGEPRAPTTTSTWRASPACRTAWLTGRASSSRRTSPTSIAGLTIS